MKQEKAENELLTLTADCESAKEVIYFRYPNAGIHLNVGRNLILQILQSEVDMQLCAKAYLI